MPVISRRDRLIFGLTNALLYVRHPLFTALFRHRLGRWPNFATPGALGDLVQWRKLFDRNPVFPVLSDKLAVKSWVAARCPELLIPQNLWVGDRPEDIDPRLLTPDVVVKTNNATSQNHFPGRDGTDYGAMVRRFRRWMARGPRYWRGRLLKPSRQWAYWPIERKIFVEKLVHGAPLVDINVRAVDGVGFLAYCATDTKTRDARDAYYWVDGTRVTSLDTPEEALDPGFVAPPQLAQAIAHAARLSRGLDYLRVDFLAGAGELYLSEITLYPAAGYGKDNWWGEVIYRFWIAAIQKSWPLSTPQPWPRSIYIAAFRRWTVARAAELGPPQDFLAAERARQEGR